MSLIKEEILRGIEEAAERMGLDNEDLLEMIEDVLDDCIEKVAGLREAAAAGDGAKLSAIGHDIKGSTINYGLLAPSAIAKDLEINKLDAVDRIDELEDVLDQLKAMSIGI